MNKWTLAQYLYESMNTYNYKYIYSAFWRKNLPCDFKVRLKSLYHNELYDLICKFLTENLYALGQNDIQNAL